jgi:hypothetical protein
MDQQDQSNQEEQPPLISPYLRGYENAPIHRIIPKMGRNDFCKFENKKFKKCCGKKGINFCEKVIENFLNQEQKSE